MPRHFFVICSSLLFRSQSQAIKMSSANIPDRCRHSTPMAIRTILQASDPVRVALHTGAWGHSFFTMIFSADRIRTGGRYCFGSVSCINSAR
jgi:hypothetical protein